MCSAFRLLGVAGAATVDRVFKLRGVTGMGKRTRLPHLFLCMSGLRGAMMIID